LETTTKEYDFVLANLGGGPAVVSGVALGSAAARRATVSLDSLPSAVPVGLAYRFKIRWRKQEVIRGSLEVVSTSSVGEVLTHRFPIRLGGGDGSDVSWFGVPEVEPTL
jgi:hypothetical protein